MRWLRLAPVALMGLAACTGGSFSSRKGPSPAALGKTGRARCDSRASLELQDVHYDGTALSGRFLVGARADSVRLDMRLLPNLDVNLDAVRDCNGGQWVAFVRGDTFPPGAREEDLLVLERGYWFGRVMGFPMFSEPSTGPGPQCIIAEFSLLSFDGACVATMQTRATREVPPTSDGGAPRGEPRPAILEGTPWSERPRLLTTLDGNAIIAAYVALRQRMELLVKEDKRSAGTCDAKPKAMEVLIFEGEGLYSVRINPRVDRCGGAELSVNAGLGSEVYAVTPEGKILGRVPYVQ